MYLSLSMAEQIVVPIPRSAARPAPGRTPAGTTSYYEREWVWCAWLFCASLCQLSTAKRHFVRIQSSAIITETLNYNSRYYHWKLRSLRLQARYGVERQIEGKFVNFIVSICINCTRAIFGTSFPNLFIIFLYACTITPRTYILFVRTLSIRITSFIPRII